MIFICFVAFLVILSTIKWMKIRQKKLRLLSECGIPGPEANLIFGNMHQLVTNNLVVIKNWSKRYGSIFGYYIGTRPYVVVGDEDLLNRILLKDFSLFRNKPRMLCDVFAVDPLMSSHLLFLRDEHWMRVRSIVSQAFTPSKLRTTMPIIRTSIDELIAELGLLNGKQIRMLPFFKSLTLKAILRSTFGVQFEEEKDKILLKNSLEFLKNEPTFIEILMIIFPEFLLPLRQMRLFYHQVLSLFSRTPEQILIEASYSMIQHRQSNPNDRKNDILQALIEAQSEKRCITSEEVAANVLLLLVAGTDTTTSALSFVVSQLAKFPDYQDKIREELMEYLNERGEFDERVVSSCRELRAFICETLRMYPPVSFVMTREASTDYEYKEFIIPKGSTIFIPAMLVQNNPEYWEEPDNFKPQRFIDCENANKVTFQPFGVGGRACIASKMAELVIHLTIGKILTQFEIKPGPDTELNDISITYQPVLIFPTQNAPVCLIPLDKK